jgi:hypothetical protein
MRRILIEKNLYFEYEVSPHRAILARISETAAESLGLRKAEVLRSRISSDAAKHAKIMATGGHIPFKQVRSKGQINPLKPPLHVETVLIGRALGQTTGYLCGVGFRIRDDGYVEAEFMHGVEKFRSFMLFEETVKSCLARSASDKD